MSTKARAVVPSSFSTANLELLKARLERLAGDSVTMQVRRDESLIGGFTVYMKNWVYDASVKARLEAVRQALSAASLPTEPDSDPEESRHAVYR